MFLVIRALPAGRLAALGNLHYFRDTTLATGEGAGSRWLEQHNDLARLDQVVVGLRVDLERGGIPAQRRDGILEGGGFPAEPLDFRRQFVLQLSLRVQRFESAHPDGGGGDPDQQDHDHGRRALGESDEDPPPAGTLPEGSSTEVAEPLTQAPQGGSGCLERELQWIQQGSSKGPFRNSMRSPENRRMQRPVERVPCDSPCGPSTGAELPGELPQPLGLVVQRGEPDPRLVNHGRIRPGQKTGV